MERRVYLKNAAIMTATSLLLRAAGMFFRVYIAARVGAEGMGVYQLITTVYTLAVTLGTAGLTIAATRIASDLLAAGKTNCVRGALGRILLLGLGTGLAAAALLFFGAGLVADLWLKEPRAALSLRILAPSLPFMALSACIRGYFMARRNVVPNSRAQIFEQIVRIGLVAFLLARAAPESVGEACAVIVTGNSVSEAASWVYMERCCRRDLRTFPKGSAPQGVNRLLAGILVPVAANQYLSSALHAVENVMVPACLTAFTLSRETALSQYGALKGMAMPVLFFPFSLLGTLSALLMPEITEAHIQGRRRTLQSLIGRVMLVTLVLSVLAGGLFTMLAEEVGQVLYQSAEIGFYIRVLGPLMPFMYLESMVDGMLKGLNEQLSTFRYTAVDSVMRIALTALLLPRWGMQGFLFVMLVSNLLTCLLNLRRLLNVAGMKIQWMRWVIKPVFSMAAAYLTCRFVLKPLIPAGTSQLGWALAAGGTATAVYFLFIWLTGCAAPQDLWMKRSETKRK